MKKEILALILVAAFALLAICLPKNNTHTCADATHKTCDGICICDGMECK